MSKPTPPRWAQRLVGWYCKPELAEDLLGDLDEYFERNVKAKGVFRARLIYAVDAFKFFRTYTIRRPDFINLLINWIMIGSYITTSRRNLMRNKLFSAINIVGLAISMSVGLLMISLVHDLLSYDKFHKNGDRIYRMNTLFEYPGEGMVEFATTSYRAAKLMHEKLPGIEHSTIVQRGFGGDAVVDENNIPISGLWADESFLNVFTFPMIHGDENTALSNPYSIVLTEQAVTKFFGDEPALGKTINVKGKDFQVTGVIKDIPDFSHMRFEALASFSTVETQRKDDKYLWAWDAVWDDYLYLVPEKGVVVDDIQSRIDAIATDENRNEPFKREFTLQPLYSIVLGKDLSNSIGPVMPVSDLWMIGGLSLVVILSACFNYTNLSIARSIRRFKEVGLRKAIGAGRAQVRQQFLSEAVIVSLLALLLSFVLFLLLREQFLRIDPDLQEIVNLELTPTMVGAFVIFSIVVGVMAGLLPAIFFSGISAIQALKDNSSVKVFRNVGLRRGLVVVQYTLTLMFITATVIGYNQYKTFLAFDLGFDTANVFNIRLQGNKPEILLKELNELPEVESSSKSSVVTSLGNFSGDYVKYKNLSDSTMTWCNAVDENYVPLFKHKFIAGQNFIARPETFEATSEVLVNETLIRNFAIAGGDPLKAIGEEIYVDRQKLRIVGVLKNFHYGKVDDSIEPVLLRYWANERDGFLNLKLRTTDPVATLEKIEAIWKKVDGIHPLHAEFYNDSIERAYGEYSVIIDIIGFLSFLAISIASLGLFGMVVFTTETRLKEISIRKVFGASAANLVLLLSRGFVVLLCISAAIALPVTYIVFESYVLTSFPFHTPVGLTELFIGLGGVLVIAFLMIGSQTLKAASSSPAEVLKNE